MALLGNIDDLRADAVASVDGIPLEIGAGRTIWVKRAGGHNREWSLGLAEVGETIPGLDAMENADRTFTLNATVAAQRLISRWQGFEDLAGEEIDYSPEAGFELFEAAPDILDEVLALALNRAAYSLQTDADL